MHELNQEFTSGHKLTGVLDGMCKDFMDALASHVYYSRHVVYQRVNYVAYRIYKKLKEDAIYHEES